MPWCISVLTLFVLAGCEPAETQDTTAPAVICSDSLDSASDALSINRFGDKPTYQGRLDVVEGRLELRPCDTDAVYLLVGGLPIEDALSEYASTQVTAADAPIYVRFHGRELSCEGELPDRYAGVVRVDYIQAHDSNVPPNCRWVGDD